MIVPASMRERVRSLYEAKADDSLHLRPSMILLNGHKPEDVRIVPLARLATRQRREDAIEEKVRALADHFRQDGSIPPLQVAANGDGTYLVLDGNHRFWGAQAVGLDRLPVVPLTPVSEAEPDEEGHWVTIDGNPVFIKGPAPDVPAGGPPGATGRPSAEDFIAARDKSTRPEFFSPLKPEDLGEHDLYLGHGGKVGYALSPDGDLQNLFNNGGPRGAGTRALFHAVDQGARTLDCYDGHLRELYTQAGLVETGRMKFNPEFASPKWDYARYNHPDVVFMAWKGWPEDGKDAALRRALGDSTKWSRGEQTSRYFSDWDAAQAHARRAAAPRRQRQTEGQAADRAGGEPGNRRGVLYRHDLTPTPYDEGGHRVDMPGGRSIFEEAASILRETAEKLAAIPLREQDEPGRLVTRIKDNVQGGLREGRWVTMDHGPVCLPGEPDDPKQACADEPPTGKEPGAGKHGAVAKTLRQEAERVEPEVTRMMRDVAASVSGALGGLEFRLKSEESLAEKIRREARELGISEEEAAKQISDVLRYTIVLARDRYVSAVLSIQRQLGQRGWQKYDEKYRKYFGRDKPYNGYNTVMENRETGQRVEIQYHTAQSFSLKMRAHVAYQQFRTAPPGSRARARTFRYMRDLWKQYQPPKGVEYLPGAAA